MLYWAGSSADALVETDLSGNISAEYVFFNGKRVARIDQPANTIAYYYSDQLGSADAITNASGTITKESDYYPYGGEIPVISGDSNRYKFSGKERDTESGLDNFGARYDSSNLGRFMTPDWAARPTAVPYAVFGDPQSLNLYGYVRNDPVSRADLDGHAAEADAFRNWGDWSPLSYGMFGMTVLASDLLSRSTMQSQEIRAQQQGKNLAWSSLSSAQQGLVPRGEKGWKALSAGAQVNYAAITHALEGTKLSDGTTGLSEIKKVREIGATGVGVEWKQGAAKAFKDSGFVSRWGLHHPGESGMIGKPTDNGIKGSFWQAQGIHVLFNEADEGATGHVHIDYRSGLAHYGDANTEVRHNYRTYKEWFGPIPGYNP